ncbi:hypothetical protein MBOURGENBZM_25000 [Methanoculleus bourgensis]|nr:hypothetical protein MBOURGENBZM_25000 [Methanoculleus bourgensis]
MSTTADHRLPEIKMRGAGGERGVAPGAPVALPLEDDPHDLVRDVCPRDMHIAWMYLLWCPMLHTHDERNLVSINKCCGRPVNLREARP